MVMVCIPTQSVGTRSSSSLLVPTLQRFSFPRSAWEHIGLDVPTKVRENEFTSSGQLSRAMHTPLPISPGLQLKQGRILPTKCDQLIVTAKLDDVPWYITAIWSALASMAVGPLRMRMSA